MKLVCISDTHHKHYYLDLPEGDILIHAGDFTFRGEKLERILVEEWLTRQAQRYEHVIFIAGNHDINMHKGCFTMLPDNCHHLQDSSVVINKIRFYGSPYSVRFGDWGFGEPDEKLAKRFSHIPQNVNVLITHGPPRGILDSNRHGEPCGSMSLYAKAVKIRDLQYHIFGHIHEHGGKIKEIDGIKFVNASVLNEYYQLVNKPIVLEI